MRTYTFWSLVLSLLFGGLFHDTAEARRNKPMPPDPEHKNALYYSNWNTAYPPWSLPIADLSHIYYAFAKIAENGTVVPGNPSIDVGQPWPGARLADQEESGTNAFGSVREMFIMKNRQRRLKVMLSIGGGSAAASFGPASATDERRRLFASSAVKLVTNWGFDGIDIDWEWPANTTQFANYVELLKATRAAFDQYIQENGLDYRFKLGTAASADPKVYEKMDVAAVNDHVDVWNILAYDYAGNTSAKATHQANLQPEGNVTNMATDTALKYYTDNGVNPKKILLGVPLYGRSFQDTAGLGEPYSGVGPGGPRPLGVKQRPGVWYFNQLPREGAKEHWDGVARASYSYDNVTREFITYDNVASSINKAHYVIARGLGGAFFWEARGDRVGAESLVSMMRTTMTHLERDKNNLDYPTSEYDNIRNCMPWLIIHKVTDSKERKHSK